MDTGPMVGEPTHGGSMTLTHATISNNSTAGESSPGGGLGAGKLTLVASTVDGNEVTGLNSVGGGVSTFDVTTIVNSTISGNVSTASGGGVFTIGRHQFILSHSTVAENHAGSKGGGVWAFIAPFGIKDSVIAGNTVGDSIPDIGNSEGAFDVNHSLIGDTSDLTTDQLDMINAGTGNLLDVDPLLGPLTDNGGPTMTHALLPGSPAIDAGDPAFVAPPYTDQRGYYRVAGGRVDMGAYETDSIVPVPGDGNLDGAVNGLDYVLWAAHFGDDPAIDPPGAPLNGDFNDDGIVDGLDYIVWAENFEAGVPAAAAVSSASKPAVVDTVVASEYGGDRGEKEDAAVVRDWQISRAMDRVFAKKRERGKL